MSSSFLINKLHKDTRLLATALTEVFEDASFDEGPFTGAQKDIYVYVPKNKGLYGQLTVSFEKSYKVNEGSHSERTIENMAIVLYSTKDSSNNSKTAILQNDYSEEDINHFMASTIVNIASMGNVTVEDIYDAIEAACADPSAFDQLSKIYRQEDEGNTSTSLTPSPVQP